MDADAAASRRHIIRILVCLIRLSLPPIAHLIVAMHLQGSNRPHLSILHEADYWIESKAARLTMVMGWD